MSASSRAVATQPITSDLIGSELVRVVVGGETDRKEFNLHKELLCSRSDYFRGALAGGFQEAEAGVVSMPEDFPPAFEIFINWLYSGLVLYPLSIPDGCRYQKTIAFIHFFLLADKLLLQDDIKTSALNNIVLSFSEGGTLPVTFLQDIFRNTATDSPLRILVMDMVCCSETWVGEPSYERVKETASTIIEKYDKVALKEFLPELLWQTRLGVPAHFDFVLRRARNSFGKADAVGIQEYSRYKVGYLQPNNIPGTEPSE